MRILYFAAVRRSMGFSEETIAPPAEVRTAGALLAWLRQQDEAHHSALSGRICIAIDQQHVDAEANLNNAGEVAFFPPVTGG